MRSITSIVDVGTFQQAIADTLRDDKCSIFLDTNVFAWSFRLNSAAASEFRTWLDDFAREDRLFIPAWVVHEYNRYLLSGDADFLLPQKVLTKQLNSAISEIDRAAHMMLSEDSAAVLGYRDKEALFSALSDASTTLQKIATQLAKGETDRKRELVHYFELLIERCALDTNIQAVAIAAAREAPARFTNRLAPGYNDAGKLENSTGDLIIWKEILAHCAAKHVEKAILITNDEKPDWEKCGRPAHAPQPHRRD